PATPTNLLRFNAKPPGPFRLATLANNHLAPSTFDVRDLRRDNGSHLEDVSRASPRERYERLVHRPADGGGSAGLLTGPVNVVSQPLFVLQWHDLTDDGRYLERRSGDQVTVSPASVEGLSTQFMTWIERALQRLQEDARTRW
ncbi:hypothetical protein AB0L97_38065, partial [Nocardia sp. NPDC051911]